MMTRRESREAWLAALAAAFAVVAWELLLELVVAPSGVQQTGRIASALAVDAVVALALARVAVALSPWATGRSLRDSPIALSAALGTLAFALLLVPGALLRAKAAALFPAFGPVTGEVDAFGPAPVARTSWLCSAALRSAAAPGLATEAVAALKAALLFQLAAFPGFCLGLALARRRIPRPLALASGTLLAAGAVAAVWPARSPVATARASVCPTGVRARSFDVSAVAVDLALNRYGDRDPAAALYVPDDSLAELRERERLPLEQRASTGLHRDVLQPLVLRAAAGECLTVKFTNRLPSGNVAFDVDGLAWAAHGEDGSALGPDAAAGPGTAVRYDIRVPDTLEAERAYLVHDAGSERVEHGLFGALVVEPRGATWREVDTGAPLRGSSWEAIVEAPAGAFREFVLFHHTIAGTPALNGRSEPARQRFLAEGANDALLFSSYTHGDPATPVLRSYLGEPTKLRVLHAGTSGPHVFDLRGSATRWENRTKVGPPLVAFGLSQHPPLGHAMWLRSDSQALDPAASFEAEMDCGAGGCQRGAGDLLLRCRIAGHAEAGEWGLWRIYDTLQPDLLPLPDAVPPPAPVTSAGLAGLFVEGRRLVPAARLRNPRRERSIEAFVEAQLPPRGAPLDRDDATTWDWSLAETPEGPVYLGEPDGPGGARPPILFNPRNGRYAWPLFRPHPGQRPPFSGNGHTPAPWLGEWADESRPDGVCPLLSLVRQGYRKRRVYSVSTAHGELLGGDRTPESAMARASAAAQRRYQRAPRDAVVLPAQVLDCLDVLYANDDRGTHERPDLDTHFVRSDPQASDGIAAGFSFSQHAEPYRAAGQVLAHGTAAGDTSVELSHVRGLRPGVFLAVGLGEGRCPEDEESAPPGAPPRDAERCTEIRRIARIDDRTLTLDAPLRHPHRAGEFAGVEFVRFLWYANGEYGLPLVRDPRTGLSSAVRARAP